MAEDLKHFFLKADQQLGFLHDYFYGAFADATDITIWEDKREDKREIPQTAEWQPVAIGDHWHGRDRYYWLHFTLAVPSLAAGEHYVLHMNLGRTGGGNNSKYEGLVFVNGKPRQAVDSNHEDAYFASEFANQTLDVYVKMWTGLEGGGPQKIQHYVLRALCAGVIDQAVVDCYDYLINIVGVIQELGEDEPLRYRYISLVKQLFKQFEWAKLNAATITAVCQSALGQIRAFIAAHPNQKKDYQITAVGHTHIDVAWLWRLRHTREKIARSFSTVLELMKEYPEYIFFQSTPQDYAYLEEDYPELWQQIKARIAEGRWEANGATWLEPDTNIPSGEALTRQFLYGSGYFKSRFDAKQNVLWLPDVFGYSAAMPQIMRGFGVNNFMTTKISWNDTNRMPHDTFNWQGIDGSQVLTHFITTLETGADFGDRMDWRYTYNGEIVPKTVFGSYHVYADKALNDDLLLAYGYGDGGGGPTREEIKNIKIINELPGAPTVVPGRVDDYFDRLNARLDQTDEPVATWRGELYLEYHRGTYTSQAHVKKWNRHAEFALRDLEMRYATAHLQKGIAYPTEQIRDLWHILLRNQFHDILPGSSIHEVYQDATVEFKQLFDGVAALHASLDDALMTADQQALTVYNPLPWTRTALLVKPTAASEFAPVLLQGQGQDQLVPITIGGLDSLSFVDCPEVAAGEVAAVEDGRITTPFYAIDYAADGHLIQIKDLRSGHELLDPALGGNVFTLYEDRPVEYDNWNIDVDYPDKATPVTADGLSLAANTADYADFVATYPLGDSTMVQTMRLYADSPRIDFITHVDWHQRQELLRTAFNTTILTDNARFDIQYGNVERPVNDNTSWDTAKFETVAHKWADLSASDYGLALLNDCKYGYRVKDQQLSLTLLKSGNYPDTVADEGEHTFTYSLLPHAGDFREGQVEQAAAELNQPLMVTTGKANDALQPLFDFGDQAIALDAIKMAEDGRYLIVRVHEFLGQHTALTLTPTFAAKAVYAGQLNEVADESVNWLQDGQVAVTLKPYQILTLCVVPQE